MKKVTIKSVKRTTYKVARKTYRICKSKPFAFAIAVAAILTQTPALYIVNLAFGMFDPKSINLFKSNDNMDSVIKAFKDVGGTGI